MNKPLTEADKRVGSNCFDKEDVLSAIELLKERVVKYGCMNSDLTIKLVLSAIDECFQLKRGK